MQRIVKRAVFSGDSASRLRARLLAAAGASLGAATVAAACSPSAGVAGLVTAPASSSNAQVALVLDASAAPDAGPVATRPLPDEPRPPPGRSGCRPQPECADPEPEALTWPFPAPFSRCKPALDAEKRFSVAETNKKRLESPETCCYVSFSCGPSHVVTTPVLGRPLLDREGVARTATFEADTRPSAWARAALLEHSSVASFARLSLSLMEHGAPLDLVALAHRAALDEITHTRMSMQFARAPEEPGPLAQRDLPMPDSLEALVHAALVEGCVGETVAALVAERGAEATTDPAEKKALRRISRDETRHAELAFRIVAWAAERAPSVVAAAIEQTLSALAVAGEPVATDVALDPSEVARVTRQAHESVVVPCLLELLLSARRAA